MPHNSVNRFVVVMTTKHNQCFKRRLGREARLTRVFRCVLVSLCAAESKGGAAEANTKGLLVGRLRRLWNWFSFQYESCSGRN